MKNIQKNGYLQMVTDYSSLKTESNAEFNQYVIVMAKSDS